MKKVVDFLEANVQWVALGLGVAWVLWMAWAFAINRPVVVKIGNEEMAPGSVDPYIVANAVDELRTKMENKTPPRIESPTWVAQFRDGMSNKNNVAVALDTPMVQPALVTAGGAGPFIPNPSLDPVAKLPVPPPAQMMEARSGKSNVAPPQPLAAAPADGAGADVQPVAQEGRDILWITSLYRIPMAELASAFREARIPVDQFNTTALEVTLQREEQLPDGSWGKLTTIKPLPTVQLMPIPPDSARVQQKTQFLQWANTHAGDILQPPFYNVLAGDAWGPPGEAPPVVVAADEPAAPAEAFDPSKYVDATHAELMKLTVDQRQQVAAYKQKLKEEERKNRDRGGREGGKGGKGGGLGGGGLGGGGGGRGGGGFGPNDGGRGGDGGGFQDPGAAAAAGESPAGREQIPPPPFDPMGPDAPRGEQPQQPAAPADAQHPIPAGEFDPSKAQDIIGWAHDDTVEAGKTYRYRVSYKLKSPVWNTANMTKPPELANTFVIESDAKRTEWGQPVKVESLSHFWVVRPAFRGDGAQVQVFRFSGGQLRTKVFDVAPGDAIGTTDGDVDFSTGWTMVDMATDGRGDRYALLMDPNGRLHARDFRADQADPKFKEMQQQATAAAAAASANGSGDSVAGTR